MASKSIMKYGYPSLKTTYFGLPIVREKYVRDDDIKALPFFEFWSDSARGIGCIGDPKTAKC